MKSKEYFQKLGFDRLTEVQNKILKLSNKNVLILSPCGSGKTEASHSKLLEWNRKFIFIEPQTTLTSSIWERLNTYHNKLGLKECKVQHSSSRQDEFLQSDFCITTIDQVLSGYLYIGKQSAIRGKNVLTSNLVFDEVQLFEPDKTLLTTINMLDELYKINNKFIIMTATMPTYLIDFLKERYNMDIIICEDEAVENRSVNISYTELLNFDIINAIQEKQIIICNTRSQQELILNNIKDKDRCIVLNSNLLPTDRLKVEKELQRYFGKNSLDNNKILVTTQVVEAGMDISARFVYSANCPIDNLVQRAGRCVRWGGEGQIIVFQTDDKIYDIDIVKKTNDIIKQNQNITFNWSIQKKWINDILNPFYEKYINDKELRKNKRLFRKYDKSKLIRDIQNINIIVDNNVSIDSFDKESVSTHINNINKISRSNKIYKLKNKTIQEVSHKQVEIGDTIVIEGYDCIYDAIGFRYKEGERCITFPYTLKKNKQKYNEYVYETWLHHAESVRSLLEYKIEQEQFSYNIIKNKKQIAFELGLHDLGKLDAEWVRGAGLIDNKPLAHFPFRKGILHSKNRNHAYISAYVLKPYVNNVIFNVILQHHKRFIDDRQPKGIDAYKLHNTYKKCLQEYGFTYEIEDSGIHKLINTKDIINPSSDEWVEFLYLEGLFMETEIQAINDYIELHNVT